MSIKANVSKLIRVHHPGEVLDEKLEEMGMSIKEFALRATKPEKTIIAVINGNSSITTEMAVSFEAVTKIPASFWLNNQRLYDEYMVRKKREDAAAASIAWMKLFPYTEMAKRGWVAATSNAMERVQNLLTYFGVSSVKAWEDYYLKKELKVAFRISLSSTKDPHAMSAWLRQAELHMAKDNSSYPPYDEKKLKASIPAMKKLMTKAPEDFFNQLQKICASCGVVLMATPTLPKAPISGATRWIRDTPVIQLSGRYKGYDYLWFNFFHELGHIIIHGKKDIFLEEAGLEGQDLIKETEANVFASETLLSRKDEQDLILHYSFSDKGIREASRKFSVHPSIIAGRLKHLGYLSYSQAQAFNKHIDIVS
jgi:addiction module HigA family antidote